MKKIIYKIKYIISAFTAVLPYISYSQSINLGGGSTLTDVIVYVIQILAIINPILFSLAFVVFFWGLSKFILNSGSKEEIEKGKNYMIWGILALFILVSFRVIISYIATDLGLGSAFGILQIPQG